MVSFLKQKKIIRTGINLDRTYIVVAIVTLFLKTPPSFEEHDYTNKFWGPKEMNCKVTLITLRERR